MERRLFREADRFDRIAEALKAVASTEEDLLLVDVAERMAKVSLGLAEALGGTGQ